MYGIYMYMTCKPYMTWGIIMFLGTYLVICTLDTCYDLMLASLPELFAQCDAIVMIITYQGHSYKILGD